MKEPTHSVTGETRAVPVITVALMAIAVVVTLLLLFSDIDEPYIGESNAHSGSLLILAPPVLCLMAAVAARFDRSVNDSTRFGWTVISAVIGLLYIPAFLALTVFIWGP